MDMRCFLGMATLEETAFEERKKHSLASLYSEDKSPKGSLDAPIEEMIHAINRSDDYYTTSSCSGRISLHVNHDGQNKGGKWMLCQHAQVSYDQLVACLVKEQFYLPDEVGEPATAAEEEVKQPQRGEVVLRHEPFVLSVECRNFSSASRLVNLAIAAGCRESGITSVSRRLMVSVRCSLRLEAPICADGKLLVPLSYLKYLLKRANEKFFLNFERSQRFYKLFASRETAPDSNSSCSPHQKELTLSHLKKIEQESKEPECGPDQKVGWALCVRKSLVVAVTRALKNKDWNDLTRRIGPCLHPFDPSKSIGDQAEIETANEAAARHEIAEKGKGEKDVYMALPIMFEATVACATALLAGPTPDTTAEAGDDAWPHEEGVPLTALLDLKEVEAGLMSTAFLQFAASKLTLSNKRRCGGKKGRQAHATGKSKTPHDRLSSAVEALFSLNEHNAQILKEFGGSSSSGMDQVMKEIPKRWEKLGDLALLPSTAFDSTSLWERLQSGDEGKGAQLLWKTVARELRVERVARQKEIARGIMRESQAEMLLGNDGWVEHKENGIIYCLDVTKCMFSSGNGTEKQRMGRITKEGDVVLDLYSGIGYFTLPFLLIGKASKVIACELNPNSVMALKKAISRNKIDSSRCEIHGGDNRKPSLKLLLANRADRVSLGLIPSSEDGWETALHALKPSGGMLHVHFNVKDGKENIQQWADELPARLRAILLASECILEDKKKWNLNVIFVSRVKSYSPRVAHIVVDVRCSHF